MSKRLLQLMECHPEIVRECLDAQERQKPIQGREGARQVKRPEPFPITSGLHKPLFPSLGDSNFAPAQ